CARAPAAAPRWCSAATPASGPPAAAATAWASARPRRPWRRGCGPPPAASTPWCSVGTRAARPPKSCWRARAQ
ncbi:unnamed protein product, partial [Prorocentrum cordatum]